MFFFKKVMIFYFWINPQTAFHSTVCSDTACYKYRTFFLKIAQFWGILGYTETAFLKLLYPKFL